MNPFKPDGRKSFAELDKNFTKKVKKKLNYKHVGKADQFIIGSMLGRTESANKQLRACDLTAREKFREILGEETEFEMMRRPHFNLPTKAYSVTVLHDPWNTGEIEAAICITTAKKYQRKCFRALDNYVAVTEIQAFQNVRHETGGRLLSVHTHGVWIPNTEVDHEAVGIRLTQKFRADDGVQSVVITPITDSLEDLLHVVGYPLKAPANCKTLYRSAIDPEKRNLHESEKGDRGVHFYRMFDILAAIDLDSLVFGHGDGRFIVNRAVSRLKTWHLTRAKHFGLTHADKTADFLDRLRKDILGPEFVRPQINPEAIN